MWGFAPSISMYRGKNANGVVVSRRFPAQTLLDFARCNACCQGGRGGLPTPSSDTRSLNTFYLQSERISRPGTLRRAFT